MHSTTHHSPVKAFSAEHTIGEGAGSSSPPKIPDHQLLRCIGIGAYGQVWLARNALGAFRAVKLVYRSNFEDQRPYEREFQGIEKFEPISRSHDGLVDILQVGRNDSAGYFYYVMELADDAAQDNGVIPSDPFAGEPLAGYRPKTLRSEIHRRGRLPFDECLKVTLSLADALSHLHGHGLVHRDVKPSNIIFVRGVPKLADIGLVAPAGETASLVGTEGYIPPEGPGTVPADIYSLGKVLYEISAGKDRRNYPEPPTQLDDLTDVDRLVEFNEVISKACASDPQRRYRSARQLREDAALLKSGGSIKRVRLIERRLALGIRISGVLLLIALLAGAAYFQASRAEKKATYRLIRSHVANAVRLVDEGDFPGALPWVAESLRLAQGDPGEEKLQRYRFAAIWNRCPKLIALGWHEKRIHHAAFSPDGRQFATASADQTAQVWETRTGRPLMAPLAHGQEVCQIAFSPDGRRLATISQDAVLRIWDSANGRLLAGPIQHRFDIRTVCFASDSRRVLTSSSPLDIYSRYIAERYFAQGGRLIAPPTGGHSGEAQVWDALTGQPLTPALVHTGRVFEASFSPDGLRLITAGEDHIARIWDATKGQELFALTHQGKVRKAIFSPDNRFLLTASEDQTAQLWDASTGRPVGPSLRHAKAVLYAAFSADGSKIVTTSRDQTACLWDTASGQLTCLPLRHNTEVRYAEFSPDGRWVVTAGSEQQVRLWDATTGDLLTQLPHNNSGTLATFSPERNRLLTISRDGLAKVWDLGPLFSTGFVLPHQRPVASAEFSPDGSRVLTVSIDRAARLWNARTGEPITARLDDTDKSAAAEFTGHFSPDGRLMVHSGVFDSARGRRLWTFPEHKSVINCSSFSPDGRRLVTGDNKGEVWIWDVQTGQPTSGRLSHPGRTTVVAFSPDNRWVAIGYSDYHDNAGVQVRDAATGQPLATPIQLRGFVSHVCFSADSENVLTACTNPPKEERAAQLWNWRTGHQVIPALRHNDGVPYAEFSPDGRRILTASFDKTARVWDAKTGQPVGPPLQHHRQVQHATFSPKGDLILTACNDGTVQLWQTASGEAIGPPFQHLGAVWRARFNPNGRQIVSASDDRTARLWQIAYTDRPIPDLLAAAALWSGQETDRTGGLTLINSKELLNRWHQLRAKYPEDFDLPPPAERVHVASTDEFSRSQGQ